MSDDLILGTNTQFMVELLQESQIDSELKEATSAAFSNPAVTWAKFILTDDLPNENRQRVPVAEFDNLVKTGVFMPIKMAKGAISKGHGGTEPLGVITNLRTIVKTVGDKVVNQIEGLAALWSRERPEDIKFLKERANSGEPINLSWEILYRDSLIDEQGVRELHGLSLKASTIVGKPAYGERTPILAIAAAGSPANLDELPDSAFLYIVEDETHSRKFPFMDRDGNITKELLASAKEEIVTSELDESVKTNLLTKVSGLEANFSMEDDTLDELELLKSELESLKAEMASTKALIAEKEAVLSAQTVELTDLREYKASIEDEANKLSKMDGIKTKFSEAGLAKDEDYFEGHKDFLLTMDEAALDFMLQELVAFSSKSVSESNSSVQAPNVPGDKVQGKKSVKELATALRELGKKTR